MSEENTLRHQLNQKLENGEIEQAEYDQLMEKFEALDLLSSRVDRRKPRNYKITGSRTIEGGEVSEPVKVSGKLRSTGSLTCPHLSVSGSAVIEGGLSVVDKTKISGKLVIEEDGKFGGPFKLSGKTTIGGSAYFTDYVKISGKVDVAQDLNSSGDIKISGKLSAINLLSTADLQLSGKVNLENDLEVESFYTSGGGSLVGGSITASRVEIAKKYRLQMDAEEPSPVSEDMDEDVSIDNLGSFISNMVTSFIPKVIGGAMSGMSMQRPPNKFTVGGNIEANTVDLSYTIVKGDIIGDDIMLGPGVIVDGVIKYRNSLTVPENSDYTIEKL